MSQDDRAATRKYQREYQRKRYHRLRAAAIDRLGGCCAQCGSTDALEFDHVDRAKKSFDVSERMTHLAVGEELEKCQLLCGSCHKKKTSSEQRVDVHGTWGMIRNRKCKCEVCKQFLNAYVREWRYRTGRRSRPSADPSLASSHSEVADVG